MKKFKQNLATYIFTLCCVSCSDLSIRPFHNTQSNLRQELQQKGQELYQQKKWLELAKILKDPVWRDCFSSPLCQHEGTLLQFTAQLRLNNVLEASRLWATLRPELILDQFSAWLYFYEGSRWLTVTQRFNEALALLDEAHKAKETYQWSWEQKIALQFREAYLRSYLHTTQQLISQNKKSSALTPPIIYKELANYLTDASQSQENLTRVYEVLYDDFLWLGQKEAEAIWPLRLWRIDSILHLSLLGTQLRTSINFDHLNKEWQLAKQQALLPTNKTIRNQRLLQLQTLLNNSIHFFTSAPSRQLAHQNSAHTVNQQLRDWFDQENKKLHKLLYSPAITPSAKRPWTEIYPNKQKDSQKSF